MRYKKLKVTENEKSKNKPKVYRLVHSGEEEQLRQKRRLRRTIKAERNHQLMNF